MLAKPAPVAPAMVQIKISTTRRIKKQKYERAKFLRLTFLAPPKENTSRRIKPTHGIENNISYPKYPTYLSGGIPQVH
jgi:hypothetical protein